jgi:hypothetical protein
MMAIAATGVFMSRNQRKARCETPLDGVIHVAWQLHQRITSEGPQLIKVQAVDADQHWHLPPDRFCNDGDETLALTLALAELVDDEEFGAVDPAQHFDDGLLQYAGIEPAAAGEIAAVFADPHVRAIGEHAQIHVAAQPSRPFGVRLHSAGEAHAPCFKPGHNLHEEQICCTPACQAHTCDVHNQSPSRREINALDFGGGDQFGCKPP